VSAPAKAQRQQNERRPVLVSVDAECRKGNAVHDLRNDQSAGLLGYRSSRRAALSGAAGASVALAGALYLSRSTVSASQRGVSSMNQNTTPNGSPTVVLVHGGFADASSWAGVIDRLQGDGFKTLAPANPLRGLVNDSTYVTNVVKTINGPVLLVGHSYGGLVITNVGAQVENAVGLVYVAAMAPDEGETMLDVAANHPKTPLFDALRPASVAPSEEETDLIIDPTLYREAFAADLPEEETRVLAATQRPFVGAALSTPSGPAAWKTLPSWYAVASADGAIHPDQQRFYANRMGATTIEVDGSHSIAVSQSAKIADLIRAALGSVA
jgi:pimeloyl-ACP methyl ester carboxylesterase